MGGLTRREALFGAAGAVVGAAGSAAVVGATVQPRPETAVVGAGPVTPFGRTQAGVERPTTPQAHGLLTVFDLDQTSLEWLAAVGEQIVRITTTTDPSELPDGPGDLTVHIGLGPRLILARGATLPGADWLPSFAGDEAIPAAHVGGDVLVAVYSSDPGALIPALRSIQSLLPETATHRWSQRGFRSPGEGFTARNPLGFLDGIIVPHTPDELDESVWIQDAPVTGATICVIRRLRLDVSAFASKPVAEREAVVGRHAGDGSPLSGGGPHDEVNLRAKTDSGDYLIPANSHVRAAHPSFTGSELMLRRGYAYDNGDGDSGLLFVCFQRSLRSFVATQQRLDDLDALMKFAHPTASATFLILPGFSEAAGLGESLR